MFYQLLVFTNFTTLRERMTYITQFALRTAILIPKLCRGYGQQCEFWLRSVPSSKRSLTILRQDKHHGMWSIQHCSHWFRKKTLPSGHTSVCWMWWTTWYSALHRTPANSFRFRRTFGVLQNVTSFITPGRLEQPTIPHIDIFIVRNQNGARTHNTLRHSFRDVT